MSQYTDEIFREWEQDGVIHRVIHQRRDIDKASSKPEPKIVKRGRLDILQDLTEQKAGWRLEADPMSPPISIIKWIRASIGGRNGEFNDIRNAIDWIIEQIGEGKR